MADCHCECELLTLILLAKNTKLHCSMLSLRRKKQKLTCYYRVFFLSITDMSDGNRQPLYLILLFVLFGFSLLPNMYAMQYLFTGPATGYVLLCFYNILTGIYSSVVRHSAC